MSPLKADFHILLIDDDLDEAELFDEAIQRIDPSIALTTFADGAEAVKHITGNEPTPDLIFLDLNMPVFSGKDVLRTLRERPRSADIPVVIYSTSISKKDIDDTTPFNVHSFLQKPESFDLLYERVGAIVMPLRK